MRWTAWCILWLASGATAAPLTVFDDDPTPADGRLEGSRIALGGGSEQGYRPLGPAEVGQRAKVGSGTSWPTIAGDGDRGSASFARIEILPGDLGWWSAELPLPPAARDGVPNLRRPALVLAVRGGQGREAVELGLTGGSPRVAVRIPLDRYGPIERQWTTYRVPLTDFTDLVPDLPLSQLQSVILFSSRPGPVTIDVDAVRFEPDSGPVGVREVATAERRSSRSRRRSRSSPSRPNRSWPRAARRPAGAARAGPTGRGPGAARRPAGAARAGAARRPAGAARAGQSR